jgi:hypothetical protein
MPLDPLIPGAVHVLGGRWKKSKGLDERASLDPLSLSPSLQALPIFRSPDGQSRGKSQRAENANRNTTWNVVERTGERMSEYQLTPLLPPEVLQYAFLVPREGGAAHF